MCDSDYAILLFNKAYFGFKIIKSFKTRKNINNKKQNFIIKLIMAIKLQFIKINLFDYLAKHDYMLVRILFKLSIIALALTIRFITYLIEINKCKTKDSICIELARTSKTSSLKRINVHQESLITIKDVIATSLPQLNDSIYSQTNKMSTFKSPVMENFLCNKTFTKSLSSLNDIDNLSETESKSCSYNIKEDLNEQINKIHDCLVKCQEENSNQFNFYEEIKFDDYYNNDQVSYFCLFCNEIFLILIIIFRTKKNSTQQLLIRMKQYLVVMKIINMGVLIMVCLIWPIKNRITVLDY
jgi:hypothetical protein